LVLYSSGAPADVEISTPNSVIAADTWYHIALVQNDTPVQWSIYVDGVQLANVYAADLAADYASDVLIGRNDDIIPYYFDGYMDELRVSNTAKWTSNFQIPTAPYSDSTYNTYGYIGSPRPLSSVIIYISTANTTAGTLTLDYFDGSDWAGTASFVDGTASGGVPLAQDGTLTFTSTESTAKPSIIDGIVLYWYRLKITECDATTSLYYMTIGSPMQTIKDTWDGIERPVLSFKRWYNTNAVYEDYTTNVFE
ncbi:unnamed protein product, partial [marine sediment metagenome]